MKLIKDYQNKKVLLLGLAKSGFNAALLLHQLGAQIIVNDLQDLSKNSDALQLEDLGIRVISGQHQPQLLKEGFDLVVKNPGINYENVMVQAALKAQVPIITEPELAYEVSQAPFICVTGSNGKTTTTTLVQLVLDQNRRQGRAYKAGNIGIPVSQVVTQAQATDDIVVEMSSFQLLGITKLKPKIAVLTNIYEAHLDYHKTRANYVKAKMRITENQTADDYFVVNFDQEEWRTLSQQSAAQVVPFSRTGVTHEGAYQEGAALYFRREKIIDVADLVLPGDHNIENYLAAIAVAKLSGKSNQDIRQVFTTFRGVKHRIQYVKTLNQRKIYNDSKATNIEATTVALQTFAQPTVLIAGGLDRGFTFESLVPLLKNVHALVLYGQTKHLMAEAAQAAGIDQVKLVKTLDEAVPVAWKLSNPGDVLLFSPAAASWDQFKTFEQRGDCFIEAVNKLGD
ncbi:UDP-N-acetylmuramoyl-L-alanine--D-glutamate ligase [Lactobacillus sp. DCY120]|uniref:UDP-N-acetylmuramoylalanine--D-glutamate ligase n=1 Tax=Bombilactobacillus apium TaxID=2675299 RepID=A0A850R565_9LACO|nr:UDP-N-acetylmuramoyl-L-alanine--D-glutamate ligase [Bombilactobacillus apium]NVY95675.1 UDP-N-acetylmuramoyl-L-alanine--D-glutamate ligase [Bombilactobacillus apium]